MEDQKGGRLLRFTDILSKAVLAIKTAGGAAACGVISCGSIFLKGTEMDHTKIIASGRLPDSVLRFAIRQSLKKHVKKDRSDPEILQKNLNLFIKEINSQPIAIMEEDANEQHYEVPTEFFKKVLGSRLKYSSCLWKKRGKLSRPESYLDEAEERMLKLTVERAELASGQTILELGCGWGSLSLYMAEKYPGTTIVAVSNSQTQKAI